MATSRRVRDQRVAEYVDSPLMRMRIRDGRRLVVRIEGHYGFYRTAVNLADGDRDSCSCPSEVRPCKHVLALRRTWRKRPRSFVDLQRLLDELSRRGRRSLVDAFRVMVLSHPECLGALGVPGFESDDTDDGERAALEEEEGDVRPGRTPDRPRFTPLQGRYLAVIHSYTALHGRAPAEADLQQYFRVSPPSVHRMILALDRRGLISRQPGQARSIRVLLERDEIPDLAPRGVA